MNDEPSLELSKSARKRQAQHILELAGEIIQIPKAELDAIVMDPDLIKVIDDARSFKSHGARRRQLHYLAKQLRARDTDNLEQLIASRRAKSHRSKQLFQQAERWRRELLSGDASRLQAFMTAFPHTDQQQLRSLVQASTAPSEAAAKSATRALFRVIYDAMQCTE